MAEPEILAFFNLRRQRAELLLGMLAAGDKSKAVHRAVVGSRLAYEHDLLKRILELAKADPTVEEFQSRLLLDARKALDAELADEIVGDRLAEAVVLCFDFNIPLPEWLAGALIARLTSGERKRSRLARYDNELRYLLVNTLRAAREEENPAVPGRLSGPGVFEVAGEDLGVTDSAVEDGFKKERRRRLKAGRPVPNAPKARPRRKG